jgi:NAD(P)-dependent dehydrogenase (short-subunit alcohol dehydrogenase family)
LINKVALVTGASRGIGKGIALQLGQNGAKVYITGRTLKSADGSPSLEQTAEEVILNFFENSRIIKDQFGCQDS